MLETLREDLRKAIESAEEQLALGFAKTFEDYRERVGYVKGLKAALDLTEPKEREKTDG